MKRTAIILTLCLSSLAACGGGGDTTGEEQTATTVDTRVVPPTLAAGEVTEVGSVSSEIQDLERACADALLPIRNLYKKYQSGLEITEADRPAFNQALSVGFSSCSSEDWRNFQEKELLGWMNAVPSDGALQEAQDEAESRVADPAPAETAPAETAPAETVPVEETTTTVASPQ